MQIRLNHIGFISYALAVDLNYLMGRPESTLVRLLAIP